MKLVFAELRSTASVSSEQDLLICPQKTPAFFPSLTLHVTYQRWLWPSTLPKIASSSCFSFFPLNSPTFDYFIVCFCSFECKLHENRSLVLASTMSPSPRTGPGTYQALERYVFNKWMDWGMSKFIYFSFFIKTTLCSLIAHFMRLIWLRITFGYFQIS